MPIIDPISPWIIIIISKTKNYTHAISVADCDNNNLCKWWGQPEKKQDDRAGDSAESNLIVWQCCKATKKGSKTHIVPEYERISEN